MIVLHKFVPAFCKPDMGQGTGRHSPAAIGAMWASHVQAVADWLDWPK
jgi:hypothetical protein